MAFPVAAGLAAGAGLLGGILGNASGAKQADANRRFAKMMSNTAHQREVRDLKRAGLNPALAYHMGGESSPTGSSSSFDNVGAAAAQAGTSAAAANASILEAGARTKLAMSQSHQLDVESQGRVDLLNSRGFNVRAGTTEANMRSGKLRLENEFLEKTFGNRAGLIGAQRVGQELSNRLGTFELPGASAAAERDKSYFGRFWLPYINSALGIFKAAAPGGLFPKNAPPRRR